MAPTLQGLIKLINTFAAHDIYAETNPAFCAAILSKFCDAYSDDKKLNPALALIYLVLPIVLSEDLAHTFEGKNKTTGLNVWLDLNPKILDGLTERINGTLEITTSAIRYGCIAKILNMHSDGSLSSHDFKIPNPIINGPNSNIFKRVRLLGIWFSGAGSERTVFEAIGVSV